jgi:hypothetical protein
MVRCFWFAVALAQHLKGKCPAKLQAPRIRTFTRFACFRGLADNHRIAGSQPNAFPAQSRGGHPLPGRAIGKYQTHAISMLPPARYSFHRIPVQAGQASQSITTLQSGARSAPQEESIHGPHAGDFTFNSERATGAVHSNFARPPRLRNSVSHSLRSGAQGEHTRRPVIWTLFFR